MPPDKYIKLILTVIACGLLALAVQNAMGPSDTPAVQNEAAPSNTAPSNKEARVFEMIHLCNSRGCIEVCDPRLGRFSAVCAASPPAASR